MGGAARKAAPEEGGLTMPGKGSSAGGSEARSQNQQLQRAADQNLAQYKDELNAGHGKKLSDPVEMKGDRGVGEKSVSRKRRSVKTPEYRGMGIT